MRKFDVITMAEDIYIKPLIESVKRAQSLYPASRFYIYDCGLSEASKSLLEKIGDTVYIEQTCVEIFPIRLVYTKRRLLKRGLQLVGDSLVRIFNKDYGNPHIDLIFKQQEFEMKIRNKLAIVQNHGLKATAPFMFIDADAFIIRPIDELMGQQFDIGLTIRDGSLNYDYNYCRLLNVGVMFFFGTIDTNNRFIKEWVKWADKNKEAYTEQTSLSRMLLSYRSDIFTKNNETYPLQIDEETIRVRILNSKEYNNVNTEAFLEEEGQTTRIIHFKNGRFNQPIYDRVIEKLNKYEHNK